MVSTLQHALHTLASGLLRRTWLFALVAVIVCSAFAARAVAALVEADYLAPPTHGSPPPPASARPSAPTRTKPDASGLVARNMFCSTCTPEPGPGPGPGPTKSSYSGKPAVLIATGVGTDPWATVRVLETEVQGSFSLGDTIPGVGRIDRIGGVSIDVVDTSGNRGTLSLRETGAATPVSEAKPAAPAADDPFADRIRQLDDHTYEVDRNLVRELVSGAARPGNMRMTPIVKAGEVQGVRVFGVKPGSAAFAIGMKNGDQITSIDNDPIKNAQQLLDLYAKLDNLTGVELQGTRAGKPLTIALRLR